MREFSIKSDSEPREDAEAVFKRNILAVLLLPPATTQPVEYILLRALLRHHTCGQLVKALAQLQDTAGCIHCADTLNTIIEMREGLEYIRGEPDKTGIRIGRPSIRDNASGGMDVVVL